MGIKRNGVVILNYKSHDLTVELVNQLLPYLSIDNICVVDNNSGDSFDNDFIDPKVHYIKNERNLGYNAGNNIGLKYLINECLCDYVYIANPDVDFENSAIAEMSKALDEDEKLVLIATKRFGYKGANIHQYFNFPDLSGSIKKCFFLTRRNFDINNNFKQNYDIDNSKGVFYVDAVPGAFFGMKSSFLKEIGFLFDGIFLYGEELFIGKQADELGYKSGIINTSCYYHNHIQTRFGKSNEKMFKNDRISLIKYYEKFNLLSTSQLLKLKFAVSLGSFEYKCMSRLYLALKGKQTTKKIHPKCSHEASLYKCADAFKVDLTQNINSPEKYLAYIADGNYERFLKLGHAVAGHNGPHGHIDTPVRNTAHYLIIYAFLFKRTSDEKYKKICWRFYSYLKAKQSESKSGAIECMTNDQFDHLNGLIGQGWVIEALIYFYEVFGDREALDIALLIYKSQKYEEYMHLWKRVELDGSEIGLDKTCNHQVMFAASAYKLAQFFPNEKIEENINDFMLYAERDFNIYNNGLLKHVVKVNCPAVNKAAKIQFIKKAMMPFRIIDKKMFDYKYIERAYHIYDMYCFAILKEKYGDAPIYKSKSYKKALNCALNITYYDRNNGINNYVKNGTPFNIFSYSYNSPAFEYPYVAFMNDCDDKSINSNIFETQKLLMLDNNTNLFSVNNPDIETWNAKSYEIIRYLDAIN